MNNVFFLKGPVASLSHAYTPHTMRSTHKILSLSLNKTLSLSLETLSLSLNTAHISEYLQMLVSMPMSLHSMEGENFFFKKKCSGLVVKKKCSGSLIQKNVVA